MNQHINVNTLIITFEDCTVKPGGCQNPPNNFLPSPIKKLSFSQLVISFSYLLFSQKLRHHRIRYACLY